MRETNTEEVNGSGHRSIDAPDVLDAWSMIESSPDGMLLADDQGRILVANTRIEELFGYRRCELVGRPVEDLLPERHRGPHQAHRIRYRAAPTVRAMGERLALSGLRQDGSEFPVEVSLSPTERNGELRVVATVRDISSRLAIDAHSHAVLDTVHAATDGVFMIDPDTLRFEYVNRGAVEQLGYTETELLEMTPLHVKPEFDRMSYDRLLEPLLTGAVDSHTFTTVHRRKDGTDVAVEIILEYPQPRRHGDRRLLVAMVRDISKRLAAELAYRKTVEAFRAAFHGAPVPVGLATIDDDGVHLSSVNEASCRLLGSQACDLLGRDVGELVIESDRERITALAGEALNRAGAVGSFETQLIRADRSVVPVWVHSSILEADTGEPTNVLIHVIDLTERQRIEEERESARLWTESLAQVRAAALDDLPLDEILTVVCRRARLLTGAKLAYVTGPDDAVDRPRVIATDPSGTDRPAPDVVVRIDTADSTVLLNLVGDEGTRLEQDRVEPVEALAAEATTALELVRARQERSRLALLEDRERMAHDFHDLVIQRLFAAGMSLQSVQCLADDAVVSSRVSQVIDEIDQAIAELRSAIFRLTADPLMSPTRRLAAIAAQARERFGFEPKLRFEGSADRIPEPVLEQMIPTLTEMLSNVARHAQADCVEVVVTGGDDMVGLRVTDNGTGFDPAVVSRSGLANLTARAQRLGGGCTIVTEPDVGTTVTWAVPTRSGMASMPDR